MIDDADKPVAPATPGSGRSGRAIVSPIVENAADLPSDRPCFDDCYTPLLHDAGDDLGSRPEKRSGKRAGGMSTHTAGAAIMRAIRIDDRQARTFQRT